MTYRIIPDSELNVDTLINNDALLFTESEVKHFSKTPWVWYNVSGEVPKTSWNNIHWYNCSKENIDFLIELGYSAYAEVISMDNTLKKALESKINSKFPISDVTMKDFLMSNKINQLGKLSYFTNMPIINEEHSKYKNMKDRELFFEYKIRGWEIAQKCYKTILQSRYSNDEIIATHITPSEEDKNKYHNLIEIVKETDTVRAFLKGSYIEYINSDKKSRLPSDIDISVVINHLNISKYLKIIQTRSAVDGIEVYPIIVPSEYTDTYSFFDLDVNRKGRFLYSKEDHTQTHNDEYNNHVNIDPIYLAKNPWKIIRVNGNLEINKLRNLAHDKEKIKGLCNSTHAHRKIYSSIRQPEIFYKRLKDIHLEHLVHKPKGQSHAFHRNLPIGEIQKLLIESSIELSDMNSRFNEHINNTYIL